MPPVAMSPVGMHPTGVPARQPPHWVGGVAASGAAAVLGGVWCRWCLGRELGALGADVPAERVTQFALLAGGLALLGWLVGAGTLLGPGRAALVVAGTVGAWTVGALALFRADQLPAWPGFDAPLALGDDGVGFAVTWSAVAGPLAVLLLATVAAALGGLGGLGGLGEVGARRAPDAAPVEGGRAATWAAGVAVALCAGAFVALQVLDWTSGTALPWPVSELCGDQDVLLVLAVGVAWVVSGRIAGATGLAGIAGTALLLSVDAAAAIPAGALQVLAGVAAVLCAVLRRPVARTLREVLVRA